ncbi:DNA (cytosine-5-)-methyltransferase [Bacillus velezensis]|uniref:DNA (cytosine-5-)-methyltransferase n=1 Tax=Bacillus velezensis TaxID=492670 RepID=UPI0023E1C03C|nr:DNA (cytosine-5-)-methyltransferase [Bacillus velezensis]WES02233.1 DNA (cytosine-5-)-methyltransferase [Bacillus velezensis]
MSKLRVMSLFSGIGAFEAALRNIGVEYELVGFSEIDKYAIKSYCAIHNVDEQLNYGDVSKIDKTFLPEFDLLVGGSPCQSFSVAGHRKGFEDTRGTLFFQYVETLKEKQPKFFVFENVKGLINHDKGNTLNVMAEAFSEVGYRIDLELLNSKFFNVPQNRERLYIIGVREDLIENDEWVIENGRNDVLAKGKNRLKELYIKSFNFKWPLQAIINKRLREILEDFVDEKYYFNEEKTRKLVEQLAASPQQKHETREPLMVGHVDLKGHDAIKRVYSPEGVSPTLTTMGGGHREPKIAVKCVGNLNPSGNGMNGKVYDSNGLSPTVTTNKGEGHKIIEEQPKYKIRKLTPLECFRLQAFDDEDFEKVFAEGISNTQLYKQAGNSITVTVLESIFKELIHTYVNEECE